MSLMGGGGGGKYMCGLVWTYFIEYFIKGIRHKYMYETLHVEL